ncbi:hypothetical protein [Streptomyces sp. PmtA]|uniref:hypothetical protein n=1 Tax=Streptomyces sp. PmtA TaxID=3074275 RepID=UPI003FCC8FDF
MAQASPEQQAEFARTRELPAPWATSLTEGISTSFLAAVGMVLLALATAVLVVRVRSSDLDALSGTPGRAARSPEAAGLR